MDSLLTTFSVLINLGAAFANFYMLGRRQKELRQLRQAVNDATPCVMMVGFLAHKAANAPEWIKEKCAEILPPYAKVTVTPMTIAKDQGIVH